VSKPSPGSPPPRQTDRGRAFLADHPVQSITIGGAPGCRIAVRLPSYRSLPLSCLEKISVWIDGEGVEKGRMELVLDGHAYGVDELASLPHVWWFILDVGELRVRLPAPLDRSELSVRGELVTVEPYISNGRFHFTSSSERTLTVIDSRGGVGGG
jgi:hypothetical protein